MESMKISVQRDILSLQFLIGLRSVSVKHNMNLNKKTTFGNTKRLMIVVLRLFTILWYIYCFGTLTRHSWIHYTRHSWIHYTN